MTTDHVLIIGGAGAIGSRLTARLAAGGARVVVVDDLSSGRRDLVPDGAELVEGDASDPALLDRLLGERRFGRIFHLAALFANANSIEHPERDLEVSGFATLRLLERAKEHAGLQRLVYVSSSCIHGPAGGALGPDSPADPETPYGITKVLGEMYCRFYAAHHHVPISIVRPFNVYGPGEFPGRYRNVIPNFIAAALRGDPLTVTGDGTETRDFTFNADLVEGLERVSRAPDALGNTYNLGSGVETAIGDLAQQIVDLTGSTSEIVFQPRRAWDHIRTRRADISAAQRDVGYDPSTPLDVGLKATIEWLRERDA